MPRVSVIMNVRNGARTLADALDSVIAQSFADWEIIFWDDGSTDESADVLGRYSDSRMRYFRSRDNDGLGQARGRAIRQARGEWLAFLDQDDIWLPHKLRQQLMLVDSTPNLGIVYGRTLAFLRGGRQREFDHRHEFRPLPEGHIYEELVANACFICMSSAMLSSAAVHELGGIPEFIRTTPDYYLFLALAKRYSARAVQDIICLYRVHSESMTATLTARIHEEVLWLLAQHAPDLDPRLVAHRRRVHASVWGFADMRHPASLASGLSRILRDGSLPYFLSRPFAKTYRAIHRRLRRPYWKLSAVRSECHDARDGEISSLVNHKPARALEEDVILMPRRVGQPARARLLGTMVSTSTQVGAQDFVSSLVAQRAGGYISCANAYSLSLALEQPQYQAILNQAVYVTADGMPVVWALRALGHDVERVHNDDLFVACCRRFQTWRHFFVGGRAGQPEEVATATRRLFPGISIVGSHPTPRRPVPASETELILQKINDSKPDVIWVGMGTPIQDEWMAEVSRRVTVPMVAVGSLFDLLSGRTKPAPEWIKRAGLQWLFRMCQEPRRLARRYFVYNAKFIAQVSRESFSNFITRRSQTR
jgi:N-acetylglucosaminyldiphosphoundecaprenol N-acetyl-beta-D-mannosaminyltransferase